MTKFQYALVGVPTLGGVLVIGLDFASRSEEAHLAFPSPLSWLGAILLGFAAVFAVAILGQSWTRRSWGKRPNGVI